MLKSKLRHFVFQSNVLLFSVLTLGVSSVYASANVSIATLSEWQANIHTGTISVVDSWNTTFEEMYPGQSALFIVPTMNVTDYKNKAALSLEYESATSISYINACKYTYGEDPDFTHQKISFSIDKGPLPKKETDPKEKFSIHLLDVKGKTKSWVFELPAKDGSGDLLDMFYQYSIDANAGEQGGDLTIKPGFDITKVTQIWFDRAGHGKYANADNTKIEMGKWDHISVTTMTPMPEPETYAMLLAGFGLIGVVVRRKRVAASNVDA